MADRMIPFDKVFMLPAEAVITPQLLAKVADTAHNRVPVYLNGCRRHVAGMLLKGVATQSNSNDTCLSCRSLTREKFIARAA